MRIYDLIKKKRCVWIGLVLLLAGWTTGCGREESTEDIAVISEASQSGEMMTEITESARQYAAENGLLLVEHTVAADTPDDYMVAVKEAADAGATVVIGYGEKFEAPLYTMQKKYKKIKFIILDGAPRETADAKVKLRKNTHAVVYNEIQAGFLAGYAAVMDGYRSLGYLGGEKTDKVQRYGSGFVQGANSAAQKLGLKKDEVKLRYTYAGTNEISPALMAEAGRWYEEGCELIFANGGSVATAVIKGAEQKGGKVITSDTDQSGASDAVVTSAVKSVRDVLYNCLNSVFEHDFKGKKKETMDLSNDGVGLVLDGASFRSFNADDYNQLVTSVLNEETEIFDQFSKTLLEEGKLENLTLAYE